MAGWRRGGRRDLAVAIFVRISEISDEIAFRYINRRDKRRDISDEIAMSEIIGG